MIGPCIDGVKVVVLVLLALFCFVRRRRSLRTQRECEANADGGVVGFGADPIATIGRQTPILGTTGSAVPDVEDQVNNVPLKTVIVGRGGRFFRCGEHIVEGRPITQVTEVDRMGVPCGPTTERRESIWDSVKELI
ncbi:MAG: hypothetical protein ACJ8R9_05695 [Steroidobacteraceae bacterium]